MIGIKDMFMPESCVDCPFYSGTAKGTCLVLADRYDNPTMCNKEFERQDWCPFVEIGESEGKDNE